VACCRTRLAQRLTRRATNIGLPSYHATASTLVQKPSLNECVHGNRWGILRTTRWIGREPLAARLKDPFGSQVGG
jgi:hypothetical protein